MNSELKAVEFREKVDGSWEALHVPSGKVTHGLTQPEADLAMRALLGMDDEGEFDEPVTSDRFSGIAKDIALHLEGPISKMLELHSGFARLEAFQHSIAHVRLGGGCQGCPSSLLTIAGGVKADLQHQFGEETILDVVPVMA